MKNNIKRYLFQLNHPAHFHLFKRTIDSLKKEGHSILITIRKKEMLEKLLIGYNYIHISKSYRKHNIFSILYSLFKRDVNLFRIACIYRPNLMIGTSPEIGHVSKFVNIPSLFLGEDDVDTSLTMYLGALSYYPFFDTILSPTGVNNGIWEKKNNTL